MAILRLAALLCVLALSLARSSAEWALATSEWRPNSDQQTVPGNAATATFGPDSGRVGHVFGVASAQTEAGGDGPLTVTTPAFASGGAISWRYTCYNILEPSPPLAWSGVPTATASLAVVFDAPERPGGVFTQWLVFNLPDETTQLAEGIPKVGELDNGAHQGRNDFGGLGFAAPCPPVLTTATYRLRLYALDSSLDLPPGVTESDFMQAAAGHVLDQVEISGSYLRPAWPWG